MESNTDFVVSSDGKCRKFNGVIVSQDEINEYIVSYGETLSREDIEILKTQPLDPKKEVVYREPKRITLDDMHR